MAAFKIAARYALEREQFGAPIASYQLVQERLATMLSDLTSMQLMCTRMSHLAGNGLLLENHVGRHLTDMEVVSTYEGTDSMQALIVGREITGISAFTRKRK